MATKNEVITKTATTKTSVKKQLASDAKKPTSNAKKMQEQTVNPALELATRIEKFEKLKSLCRKRETLNNTLNDLHRFTYNNDGSALFFLRSSNGENEFKSNNTNLISLIATQLEKTLEERREELNSAIIAFEL